MKTGVYYSPYADLIFLYQWVLDEHDILHWKISYKGHEDPGALHAIAYLHVAEAIYLGPF